MKNIFCFNFILVVVILQLKYFIACYIETNFIYHIPLYTTFNDVCTETLIIKQSIIETLLPFLQFRMCSYALTAECRFFTLPHIRNNTNEIFT